MAKRVNKETKKVGADVTPTQEENDTENGEEQGLDEELEHDETVPGSTRHKRDKLLRVDGKLPTSRKRGGGSEDGHGNERIPSDLPDGKMVKSSTRSKATSSNARSVTQHRPTTAQKREKSGANQSRRTSEKRSVHVVKEIETSKKVRSGSDEKDQDKGSVPKKDTLKKLVKDDKTVHGTSRHANFSSDEEDFADNGKSRQRRPTRTERTEKYNSKTVIVQKHGANRKYNINSTSEFSADEEELEEQRQAGSTKGKSTWLASKISLLVCVLVFGILAFNEFVKHSASQSECFTRKRSNRFGILMDETDIIRGMYPSINQSVWDVIAGASWSHVNDKQELERPVVLLLAGQPGKANIKDVADDVADMYANVYSQRRTQLDIIRVVGANLENMTENKAKLDMDTQIKSGLRGCSHVVLITDLDKIPPCSAILYHGYCDNDSAPFKDAVFIFTMTLEKDLSQDATKDSDDDIIQDQLQKKWSQCPTVFTQAKIVSMYSRLANNAIILK